MPTYAFSNYSDTHIELLINGTISKLIKKANIDFSISGDELTIFHHRIERNKSEYRLTVDYNDVTSPVVASAAALQAAIEAWLAPAPGGTGDVVGPASAVDSNLVAFDGITGLLLKDSGESVASLKAYADGLVVGLWDDRGTHDASGGAYPSTGGSGTAGAILKGDIWVVSVAGTLPTGQVVEVGDTVRALVDTPGNTQANWAIIQNNIGYVPENVVNKDTDGTLAANSDTKYPSQKAVKTYVDGIARSYLIGYNGNTATTNTVALERPCGVPIPGGTLEVGDMIVCKWFIKKTSGAGSMTGNIYLHTAATTGGTPYGAGTLGATQGFQGEVNILIIGATSQIGSPNAIAVYGSAISADYTTSSLDIANDMYVNVLTQKSVGTDNGFVRYQTVEIIKKL